MEIEYKHVFTSEEKLKHWGYGEWVEEADECRFEHNGIQCKILRVYYVDADILFDGHLCGYCKIPSSHSDINVDYTENYDYKAYGGITYDSVNKHLERWIGFDCAHSNDVVPSMNKVKDDSIIFHGSYKNMKFVENECRNLAEQITLKYNMRSSVGKNENSSQI